MLQPETLEPGPWAGIAAAGVLAVLAAIPGGPLDILPLPLALGLLAAGAALMVFMLCSCCLGLLLLFIPVVGAVVMLPLLWLHRGFGAAFLDFGE